MSKPTQAMTKREEMARALAAKSAELYSPQFIADLDWRPWLPFADAVLDCLKEPSEDMVDSLADRMTGREAAIVISGYTLMIRALREGK